MPLSLFNRRRKSLSNIEISWPLERQTTSSKEKEESGTLDLMSLNSSPTSIQVLGPTFVAVNTPMSSRRLDRRETSSTYEGRGGLSLHCSAPELTGQDPLRALSHNILEAAGDLPIIDENCESIPFRSLWTPPTAIADQQLILFVRHFFCGVRRGLRYTTAQYAHSIYRLARHIFVSYPMSSRSRHTSTFRCRPQS